MSRKELSRVEVMSRVKARSLRLGEAAELLEVSYRQSKRIWARYRGGGAKALQHGNCGRIDQLVGLDVQGIHAAGLIEPEAPEADGRGLAFEVEGGRAG